MVDQHVYRSGQTGRLWHIHTGVYYDCHVVSIPQVLSVEMFHEWLTIVACPTVKSGWNGLYCRQLLDSEVLRDKVLFGTFGVKKTHIDISGDPTRIIESEVRKNGYLICRVDSYYHPHFQKDYHQNHSPGHKVTVIDFDEDTFSILDNNGTFTTVLKLPRAELIDSVLSNLYYAYDKEDTFYRLDLPSPEERGRLRFGIEKALEGTFTGFVQNRSQIEPGLTALRAAFLPALESAEQMRSYTWIRHVYKTALTTEFCYNALLEASPVVMRHWERIAQGDGRAALVAMREASTGWRYLKVLCKAAETENQSASYVSRIQNALDAILERENKFSGLICHTNEYA
jgi:hypothetical protein